MYVSAKYCIGREVHEMLDSEPTVISKSAAIDETVGSG